MKNLVPYNIQVFFSKERLIRHPEESQVIYGFKATNTAGRYWRRKVYPLAEKMASYLEMDREKPLPTEFAPEGANWNYAIRRKDAF
jgi:hypothetical protein